MLASLTSAPVEVDDDVRNVELLQHRQVVGEAVELPFRRDQQVWPRGQQAFEVKALIVERTDIDQLSEPW